ncbi:vitamin K epoxide reductase family protein, partial [Patescibacteria group bacterium AH-259-L05]|nr:vitamin K epoxide reductase family protein [Patescibacteria group bacterium AH-259-L05]
MNLLLHIVLIFIAFSGFSLSFYIYHKKRLKQAVVCPMGAKCEEVIYSEYSRFLGIPIELLGMVYYGIIALSYGLFLVYSIAVTPFTTFLVLGVTIIAFLFSLYLTFLQAFSIKQWCSWCLISAGFCTSIFAIALAASKFSFISILDKNHEFIVVLHLLGMAIGLGGATISDVFFFKFLKDFRISSWEADVLHTLSQVIWFALAFIVLTGFGLYLPEAQELISSSKFLVKIVVVLVIIINGAFLNLLISPKLIHISFRQKHDHRKGELSYLRRLAFALGAVSLTSWYSAFVLGALRDVSVSFLPLLLMYLGVVAIAVAISQLVEHSISK